MSGIGISEKDQKFSAALLNYILADEFVLFVKTLNYHWNLTGPEFHDYHKFFDEQYHDLLEVVDSVAERVRIVGGIALGSMKEFLASAQLEEESSKIPKPKEMVKELLKCHEGVIIEIREGVNKTAENNRDMGTNNFLTDLLEKHEKIAWMLRSLL